MWKGIHRLVGFSISARKKGQNWRIIDGGGHVAGTYQIQIPGIENTVGRYLFIRFSVVARLHVGGVIWRDYKSSA